MKAKKISDILKPKTQEEILDAIKSIKLKSYNLKSFFALVNKEDTDNLTKICKSLNIDPYLMDVSRITASYYDDSPPTIIETLFNKAFVIDKTKTLKGIVYHSNYDPEYQYCLNYKIIRWRQTTLSKFDYYAYPRNEIAEILSQLFYS